MGAIVGERIGANKGLGAPTIQSTFNHRSDLLYAAVILSSSRAVSIFIAAAVLKRMMIRYAWRLGSRRSAGREIAGVSPARRPAGAASAPGHGL